MNTTTLQIPISKDLKQSAAAVAKEFGFSSLQEIVRVILTKLSRKELTLEITSSVPPEYIKLSPAAKKRYAKMKKDFKTGENIFQARDVDDLLRQLNAWISSIIKDSWNTISREFLLIQHSWKDMKNEYVSFSITPKIQYFRIIHWPGILKIIEPFQWQVISEWFIILRKTQSTY